MTYEETIEWLYKQLPMFSRIGVAAYKEDLHNTIALCNSIDNPQKKFKSIHVAGTNGKGSTSHMLAAILQESGYKTGLYTSPHIKDFRERIRINGEMIQKDFVIDFVQKTKNITEQVNPSFFELTVAMAFDYFAMHEVDIAIIETGLGGRLDSTNVITPVLSVITNIGYDHTNILGNTLTQIAAEKAGIIKNNVPVVVGEVIEETFPVFVQKAAEMGAEIYLAQEKYVTEYIYQLSQVMECHVRNKTTNVIEKLELDLQGSYQAKNICTVLCAVDILNKLGYVINRSTVHKALKHVKPLTGLSGRWDIIQTHPTVILDVAHNAAGIEQVLSQLKTDHPAATIHFILGFVNDKDVNKLLSLFPRQAKYYFTNANIPRAMDHATLKQYAASNQLHGQGFNNVNDAIATAKKNAGKDDVIMVCGSFFIIAEVNYADDPVHSSG